MVVNSKAPFYICTNELPDVVVNDVNVQLRIEQFKTKTLPRHLMKAGVKEYVIQYSFSY